MTPTTITYFDWDDIQTEICKKLNIKDEDFRDYHKVIGGDYKNLWHEWMKYFDCDVRNGGISNNDLGEAMWSKLEWVNNNDKAWLEPFVKAVYEVWDEHNIKWVRYFW